MKIGVVTVHDSANYGSFLQAYALNEVLKGMGHEACFLRTRGKAYVKSLYYNYQLSRDAVLHPISRVRRFFYGVKKYRIFTREQRCFTVSEDYSLLKPDTVILGSDEIWNVRTAVFRNGIFYGDGMHNVIAYAVSVGLSKEEDFLKHEHICEMIRRLTCIMARDKNTAECVEKITGTMPELVCDPTFLISADSFTVQQYRNKYLEENKYVLVYAYEPGEKVRRILCEFAKRNGLKLVAVCLYHSWCDKNIICSPLEFCSVISGAECVITTTFHGTVFSVLNHKRFVSIPFSQKTEDILKRLGLESCSAGFDELTVGILEQRLTEAKCDYEAVDSKIKELRNRSLELLKSKLEVYENENL